MVDGTAPQLPFHNPESPVFQQRMVLGPAGEVLPWVQGSGPPGLGQPLHSLLVRPQPGEDISGSGWGQNLDLHRGELLGIPPLFCAPGLEQGSSPPAHGKWIWVEPGTNPGRFIHRTAVWP